MCSHSLSPLCAGARHDSNFEWPDQRFDCSVPLLSVPAWFDTCQCHRIRVRPVLRPWLVSWSFFLDLSKVTRSFTVMLLPLCFVQFTISLFWAKIVKNLTFLSLGRVVLSTPRYIVLLALPLFHDSAPGWGGRWLAGARPTSALSTNVLVTHNTQGSWVRHDVTTHTTLVNSTWSTSWAIFDSFYTKLILV